MIRKLRIKFIFIASCAIVIILLIVLSSINFVNYYSNYSEVISILTYISNHNGRLNIDYQKRDNLELNFHLTQEMPYEIRYFTVIADSENNIAFRDFSHIASVSDSDTEKIYNKTLKNNLGKGRLTTGENSLFYISKNVSGKELSKEYQSELFDENETYRLVAFMDVSNRVYRIKNMLFISIITGFACLILFMLIVSALSQKIVRPVIESYDKQKQFITNAGHELKTPLAIISANTEVMEAMDGSNEWTQSTLNQVKRLSGLVNELITLARLEEAPENEKIVYESFDLSKKLNEMINDFRPVIEQQNKSVKTDIIGGIKIKGNEKSIHELISILLDNAAKYCDDNGCIKIKLTLLKKNIIFIVANTYKEGKNIDTKRFFERFYRGDSSHNQEKAGYGIGLSMAEGIVKLHKGKISADYSGDDIAFKITLPM